MNKKAILSVVLSSLLVWGLYPPTAGYASKNSIKKINRELADLRAKKRAQQSEMRKIENKLEDIKRERGELENELMAIDIKLDNAQKQLEKLNKQIDTTTEKVVEAQVQLDEAIERVAKREDLLKTRVKTMYKRGPVSYTEVLLGSSDFGDFLTRMEGLKVIVEQDTRILEDNIRDKEIIEKKKKEKEEHLAQLENMYEDVENLKAQLAQQQKRNLAVKKELQKQEHKYHEILEEEEEKLQEIVNLEAAKVAERSRLSSVSSYTGGRLGLPIAAGSFRFTSGFGSRKDPITGSVASHNGLDLAAPRGTDILAAEDGIVVFAGVSRGYGNTVVIQHNQEIRTLYAHIREGGIKVSVGQAVKRGEKIAEVGSTGRSTGNHLHFTVYKNGKAVDPAPYIR